MTRTSLLAAACLAAFAAHADEIPLAQARQMCAAGDTGPRTVYGETKSEVAAKKVMFAWTCMALVDGDAKQAFARYVARDFCDHSHMINAGLKQCSGYDETERAFAGMSKMLVRDGNIEFPVIATVNGEMVTQYGAGADIFRVHDGKITDHWDASPPKTVTLTAHDKAFSDRMQAQIDSGHANPHVGLTAGPPSP